MYAIIATSGTATLPTQTLGNIEQVIHQPPNPSRINFLVLVL